MKTLITYLQLFPTIIAAIQSLENAIPVPASGKKKLDLLLQIVKAAFDTEESVRREIPWEKLSTLVSSAVNLIVAAFNGLGVFQHAQPHQ